MDVKSQMQSCIEISIVDLSVFSLWIRLKHRHCRKKSGREIGHRYPHLTGCSGKPVTLVMPHGLSDRSKPGVVA